MLPAMVKKPRIAIVGPGRLGSALSLELQRAGYKVSELIVKRRSRQVAALARRLRAQILPQDNPDIEADVVWFCVPDREIAPAARVLALKRDWKGRAAFHSSGALPSTELEELQKRGATIASVHPLMTFVRGTLPSLDGVTFAVEGDDLALRIAKKIVRDLGGDPFEMRVQNKVAYHTWGAFTSPLLVALLVAAEHVAGAAGLSVAAARKKMLPILRQTIQNYGRLGPARAFSGPLVRGDAEIVRKHLNLLKRIPEAKDVYTALARIAISHLPVQRRAELRKAISEH